MKQYNGKIGDGITLLKFSTPSCAPCKILGKTLDELAPQFQTIDMLDVDCEKWPELAGEFMIQSVPTCFIIDKDGNKLSQIYGNSIKSTIVTILKGVL